MVRSPVARRRPRPDGGPARGWAGRRERHARTGSPRRRPRRRERRGPNGGDAVSVDRRQFEPARIGTNSGSSKSCTSTGPVLSCPGSWWLIATTNLRFSRRQSRRHRPSGPPPSRTGRRPRARRRPRPATSSGRPSRPRPRPGQSSSMTCGCSVLLAPHRGVMIPGVHGRSWPEPRGRRPRDGTRR